LYARAAAAPSPVPAIRREWPVRVMLRGRPPRSIAGMTTIVLSGGGERVIAWHLGVLAGLAAAGRDPRRAALIGTSAGALVAARVAAGVDPRADALSVRPPSADPDYERLTLLWGARDGSVDERRRRIGAVALNHTGDPEPFVQAVRRRLAGSDFPPSLTIVAVDAESGERVAFAAADGVPLERAVAASQAVPGLVPPIPIAGRRFIDGAVGSATNADLARTPAVLVVSGIADRPRPRTPEPLWADALGREVAALEAAGHEVAVVRPREAGTVAAGRRAGRAAA
jgi:NTE family protein